MGSPSVNDMSSMVSSRKNFNSIDRKPVQPKHKSLLRNSSMSSTSYNDASSMNIKSSVQRPSLLDDKSGHIIVEEDFNVTKDGYRSH
jgi:hypothetical protein